MKPNCKNCGYCCSYVTVQIDDPEDDIDWEEMKWWLCHENVLLYIDHDDYAENYSEKMLDDN